MTAPTPADRPREARPGPCPPLGGRPEATTALRTAAWDSPKTVPSGAGIIADQDTEVPRKQTILVVDDEEDILESLKDLLETSIPNSRVLTAANGEAGMKVLEEEHTDLIVTDYKMPGMSGLDFLEESKKLAPKTPRILVTAFPDLEIALRAINDAKIENFFTKPLDPPKIVEVITDVLDTQRAQWQRDQAFARSLSMAKKRGQS